MTPRTYRITSKFVSIARDDYVHLYVVAVDADPCVAAHEGDDHGGMTLHRTYADQLAPGDELEIEGLGVDCVVYRHGEIFFAFGASP